MQETSPNPCVNVVHLGFSRAMGRESQFHLGATKIIPKGPALLQAAQQHVGTGTLKNEKLKSI